MNMEKEMNVFIESLGCPKNFVDTEVITAYFLTSGFGVSVVPEEAEIYLINTCAFIEPARIEAENSIERALDWKKQTNGIIIVSGCLNQWDRKGEYREKYPDVDFWTGIDEIEKISDYLFRKENYTGKINFNPAYLYNDKTPRLQLSPPAYAYVKIAEGCNNRCSYCLIPSIRGEQRCREPESVLEESRNLINNGVRELILIAQDTSAYRYGDYSFSNLLDDLDSLKGNFNIRILYTHPASMTIETIDAMKNSKHILPYIDMPIQHISDRILKGMNRHISSKEIRNLIRLIKEKIPEILIRTTFITGFPGETENEFAELKEFIEESRFQRLGVFPYYRESGTAAAEMHCRVDEKTAESRAEELMHIQAKISKKFNKSFVNKNLNAIVDTVDS